MKSIFPAARIDKNIYKNLDAIYLGDTFLDAIYED